MMVKKREEEREEGGEDPFLSKGDVQLGGSLQRTLFSEIHRMRC